MTIGKKLIIAFGAMLGMALILGGIAEQAIEGLNRDLNRAVNVTARRQFLAGDIGGATSEMEALERGIALSVILQQADRSSAYQQKFQAAALRLDRALTEFRSLLEEGEPHQAVDLLADKSHAVMEAHRSFLSLLGAQQMDAALKTFDETLLLRVVDISGMGRQLADQQSKALATASEIAGTHSVRTRWIMGLLMALALGIGVAALLLVRQANACLHGLARRMAEGAERVANAAAQVSSASQSLAQGASEQAATLEQTSEATEQVTTVTRTNAERSRSMAGLMGESGKLVQKANRTLEEMIGSMHEITDSADRISRIIKVIDEIAFQTNMLVLTN
jgi:methyl-accepting chemotaxis protein/methyl-accepting chemotaxis protein-1 (serine sensor receptor)